MFDALVHTPTTLILRGCHRESIYNLSLLTNSICFMKTTLLEGQ